jgi:carbon-monoxide dehydrogenase large subunit
VEAEPDGTVTLFSGTLSTGQGLETVLANLVAESLGISPEKVRYVQGDTDRLANGKGSGGSAALATGGPVAIMCAERLIESGREFVARHLGAEVDEIDYSDGLFVRAGSNVSVSLAEAAELARQSDADRTKTLVGETSFKPPRPTYPSGCHICEVEVDPETGWVEVLKYVAVEDVGRVLNPLLVEGQIHGGVAQGIGQAIKEVVVHDDTGQLLTGTFMDYGMPLASDIPNIHSENVEVPTQVNPLGVKGVGEAGTVGALSATMNAVCDALAPLGVRHLDMPASPHRIWQAIEAARSAPGASKGAR